MDRNSAITAIKEELENFAIMFNPSITRQVLKRPRLDDNDGDNSGSPGGAESGGPGSPDLWKESFKKPVSSLFFRNAGDAGPTDQRQSDSDIGFFRDDPQDKMKSSGNAKKWALEQIRMGSAIGMTLED
ncbi:hypothetical protein M427DRAFT_57235 [Gonapodya prolifera JEL478]|uniref:Uncharacterized protein n=1 Tax=Gonapodya prolifera (strain JEL478) TaxID=1344416 RepID=A0A139AEI4_GONPJ|nr:hypothetical protein M427DRAFT_57235 [Gonapodya prolifera JEL478]|eukprot:KXS14833.1 hypothetical protein M427DRAFT_57235 [Gonapodya prolifera JEL478]